MKTHMYKITFMGGISHTVSAKTLSHALILAQANQIKSGNGIIATSARKLGCIEPVEDYKCNEVIRGPLGSAVGQCELDIGHKGRHQINGMTEQDMVSSLCCGDATHGCEV